MASTTAVKRLIIEGDFSKCREQELKNQLPKYFEEYGSVSDLELCDSDRKTLTLTVKDESGKEAERVWFLPLGALSVPGSYVYT